MDDVIVKSFLVMLTGLPDTSPFWTTPNTYITSHTSAPSFPADIVGVFVENYRRFHRGETLLHRVDFERGY